MQLYRIDYYVMGILSLLSSLLGFGVTFRIDALFDGLIFASACSLLFVIILRIAYNFFQFHGKIDSIIVGGQRS